jgi:hypothetical protein
MMEYIIHNLFSTEAGVVWLVLKWILVVLAAGFVGQFGKAFATHLMRRTRQPMEPSLQSLPEAGLAGKPCAAADTPRRAGGRKEGNEGAGEAAEESAEEPEKTFQIIRTD